MTIDERIAELKDKHEMLSERHNALVLSIELMILENRERDQIWNQRSKEFDSRLDKLLQIAEFHQHRLNNNDDRLDTLEGDA